MVLIPSAILSNAEKYNSTVFMRHSYLEPFSVVDDENDQFLTFDAYEQRIFLRLFTLWNINDYRRGVDIDRIYHSQSTIYVERGRNISI